MGLLNKLLNKSKIKKEETEKNEESHCSISKNDELLLVEKSLSVFVNSLEGFKVEAFIFTKTRCVWSTYPSKLKPAIAIDLNTFDTSNLISFSNAQAYFTFNDYEYEKYIMETFKINFDYIRKIKEFYEKIKKIEAVRFSDFSEYFDNLKLNSLQVEKENEIANIIKRNFISFWANQSKTLSLSINSDFIAYALSVVKLIKNDDNEPFFVIDEKEVKNNFLLAKLNYLIDENEWQFQLLCKSIRIFRIVEELQNHKELMIMKTNLENAHVEMTYQNDKLYEQFDSIYRKDFSDSEYIDFIDRDAFDKLISELDMKYLEENDSEQTFHNISFDYEKEENFNDENIVFYLSNLQEEYSPERVISLRIDSQYQYLKLVKFCCSSYSLRFILSLIYNSSNIIDKICEAKNKIRLEKERQRLLLGDLEYERKLFQEKFNLATITNGYNFEGYLKNLFTQSGFIAKQTKLSGDQGADLILSKGKDSIVVQAKYYTTPVSNKAVQEVVASKAIYKANKAIVVTNSSFTQSAKELANANNVILIDGLKLDNIIDCIAKNKEWIF